MSELVCYIERAERGVLPVRLRLVSTRVEEVWAFPEILSDDRAALQRGLQEAAAWVAERVRTHGRGGLGALVLDTDGSLCSWVSASSEDPDAIGASLRHSGATGGEEEMSQMAGSPPHLSLCPEVHSLGGASVQPLTLAGSPGQTAGAHGGKGHPGAGQARRRLGVVVVPDATVRLLLDELDARGVLIRRVLTIWHAMVEAFDAGGGLSRAERVVADVGATTAQMLVDGWAGRVLWCWSRGGVPVAAGAIRLPRSIAGEDVRVALDRAGLARLASEWIAWSTQLGASPSRVRLVLPQGVWSEEASLGESVAAVWPGATADITFDDDPVGLTLSRFADGLDGARESGETRPALAPLQNRPGRQHRAMYRWAAVAVAVAGAVMGVAAYRVHALAGATRERAGEARSVWRRIAGEIYPVVNEGQAGSPVYDSRAVADVQAELERRRKETAPVQITPEKPILAELETLSHVLGNSDYQLSRLDLSSTAVIIDVTVPDTAAYEELMESLNLISNSSVFQWQSTEREVPGQPGAIRASFTGLWSVSSRTGGGQS